MRSRGVWVPALTGAAAFWVANLAISLTPVAADYRRALSISYVPMLVEAAIGGLGIGLLASWSLRRFRDRIPGSQPVVQALVLGFAVLLAVTVVVEVPGKFAASTDRPGHYLLIATVFNALRIAALAVVIGYLQEPFAVRGRRASGRSGGG